MTSGHEDGMRVAIRHFPARAAEIQTLIGESERFREMCAELAAAEDALAAVGRLDEGLRGSGGWNGSASSALPWRRSSASFAASPSSP
jgi:hypothetical protein